jgi:predicted HD superfamily hydrolase involved in NAD metabolism
VDEKVIIEKLAGLISPERLKHSIRVKEQARELAFFYNEDVDKATLAGLLHDCAKGYRGHELIQKSKEYGVEVDGISIYKKGLIHGPLGAKVAYHLFKVKDPYILSAIKYHTYGRKDMTMLEKIIYLADLIEPDRNFRDVEKLRVLAFKDIDEALLKAMDDTIALMISRDDLIHPNTLEARNSLILSRKVLQ